MLPHVKKDEWVKTKPFRFTELVVTFLFIYLFLQTNEIFYFTLWGVKFFFFPYVVIGVN